MYARSDAVTLHIVAVLLQKTWSRGYPEIENFPLLALVLNLFPFLEYKGFLIICFRYGDRKTRQDICVPKIPLIFDWGGHDV